MNDKNKLSPIIFIGHGSPMNAIDDNEFSRAWRELGDSLSKPKAILCISAHWQTKGSFVTAMDKPKTIHDFGGFPKALYDVEYHAQGSPAFAKECSEKITNYNIELNQDWGLDHGAWSVIKPMYPMADIPVFQLSLDYSLSPQYHYSLAKELAFLRSEGVLIIGSGNLVHNLRLMSIRSEDINEEFGFDWALEANAIIKKLIDENKHEDLINYNRLGRSVQMAAPTPEHFLPALYILALKRENEKHRYFNDKAVAGSLTMTSFIIGE